MKFFSIGLDEAVSSDIKKIFCNLGHQVDSWKNCSLPIDFHNWKQIDPEMCDKFHDKYKAELSVYDAFVVSRPVSLSLLLQKFDKPIVLICSNRYEAPFSGDLAKWSWFNRFLNSGIQSGKVFPLANNKYDAQYFKWFTYENCLDVIPNICEFSGATYRGIYDNCLFSSKFKCALDADYVVDEDVVFDDGDLFEDFTKFRAVIHIPYNASSTTVFEQYTAGVPLIFPSWDFLKRLREDYRSFGVLSELSLNQGLNLPSRSLMYCGPDEEDPNNYTNNEVMMEWAKLADCYDRVMMPEIIYFDSLTDLYGIIDSYDFREHSAIQLENVANRRDLVLAKWRTVLELVNEAAR